MEMLQGVWKQHLRPRAVVGYGVKIILPSSPNYVARSPGQGELLTEQLHDVSTGKFPILIYSRESLYEESLPEQLLKLQKNIVCIAVDDVHCVSQL